jgi:putative PIN family toxin of toxin-antitoxin system
MRRVVIDTNIMVASLFGGRSRQLVDLWRTGALTLCLSEEIRGEYLDILTRFTRVRPDVRKLIASLEAGENAALVEPAERTDAVADDPADNAFLECAIAAEAEAIISTDRHLLDLGTFRGIPILQPGRFLEVVEAS